MIKELKVLARDIPNDQDLGKAIRALLDHSYDDLIKLELASGRKIAAVKTQAFEEAAEARNEERDLLLKIGLLK